MLARRPKRWYPASRPIALDLVLGRRNVPHLGTILPVAIGGIYGFVRILTKWRGELSVER